MIEYEKKTWHNKGDGSGVKTPLNAENLNRIEGGVSACVEAVNLMADEITIVRKDYASITTPSGAEYMAFNSTPEGGYPGIEGKVCIGAFVYNWSNTSPRSCFNITKDYFIANPGTTITNLVVTFVYIPIRS